MVIQCVGSGPARPAHHPSAQPFVHPTRHGGNQRRVVGLKRLVESDRGPGCLGNVVKVLGLREPRELGDVSVGE
ncbi:MAG: hypothetical protein PHF56_15970 [Desulfuromonadaceae bacterium]|nr:hypothetical protein [Desulfuromonadaceae bacterium]